MMSHYTAANINDIVSGITQRHITMGKTAFRKTPDKNDHQILSFEQQARHILELRVFHRVNELGGYGADGEVIYQSHPTGCPSVLVNQQKDAKATFMSNGSTSFEIKLPSGKDVHILTPSFNPVDKHEYGVSSQNVWIRLEDTKNTTSRLSSLLNPSVNLNLKPSEIKIVKLGDPNSAMWYCGDFTPEKGLRFHTAMKLTLVYTKNGPALLREVFIINIGTKTLNASIWTYFKTSSTQYLVYNRPNWYDIGLPVSLTESVVSGSVPYCDNLQIKRISSAALNCRPMDATCDYQTFVGDTSASILFPKAVLENQMQSGAGRKMNRFSTSSVAANQFGLHLANSQSAILHQSLLYITDKPIMRTFRKRISSNSSAYKDVARAFLAGAKQLIHATSDAHPLRASRLSNLRPAKRSSYFAIELPYQKIVSEYANSVWTGVQELYENCRAHGAMLADGIEIGTRDRGQDMWPKMKEDPARVRRDLVHALGMMYVTCETTPIVGRKRLTLVEKLHGMFPRQYPSRWLDRSHEINNDNRPYADSPLWLINSVYKYLCETGDISILSERVPSVKLVNPANPIHSGMVGSKRTFRIVEVLLEILESFQRMADDSPYGIVQILYGDWCDPIDMYGTKAVGDADSRGMGQGVQIRLSAHVFQCIVQVIDIFSAPNLKRIVQTYKLKHRIDSLKQFVNQLRKNIVQWGWEDTNQSKFFAGFLCCIHEYHLDGSIPDYANGQTGYTLGSMQKRDFDKDNRRELTSNAYGLSMLMTNRPYLDPIPDEQNMIDKIITLMRDQFYDSKLGLRLFTRPIPNTTHAIQYAGRMGMIPAGTAENGEYHHGQMFMHRFLQERPGQIDMGYKYLQPMLSALRDSSLAGPFETPATSYAADRNDPHFGKGMYFGLSGSTDWIVEYFETMAGLQLNLFDDSKPDVVIDPRLPRVMNNTLNFRRILHVSNGKGRYRKVPIEISIQGNNTSASNQTGIRINGKITKIAEIASLANMKNLKVKIQY